MMMFFVGRGEEKYSRLDADWSGLAHRRQNRGCDVTAVCKGAATQDPLSDIITKGFFIITGLHRKSYYSNFHSSFTRSFLLNVIEFTWSRCPVDNSGKLYELYLPTYWNVTGSVWPTWA